MIDYILRKERLNPDDLLALLQLDNPADLTRLYAAAYAVKKRCVGARTYLRGLIEFSNICDKDCCYCGIRRGNNTISRYEISKREILRLARWAYEQGYGSVTLQAGERQDAGYTARAADIIAGIKAIGSGKLGVTLSLGEQSPDTYRRWFEAGAHRYLLRIETSSRALYDTLHPNDANHRYERRLACIDNLKAIGYQTGSGIMIGLPGQTAADLVADLLFFEQADVPMVGMGPYAVHQNTPTGQAVTAQGQDTAEARQKRFALALKMIAVTRLYLKDINIAAATALEALHPLGRELALKAGANILMPIITRPEHRQRYQLYDNKPGLEAGAGETLARIAARVESAGDTIGFGEWGDAPRFTQKAADCKGIDN